MNQDFRADLLLAISDKSIVDLAICKGENQVATGRIVKVQGAARDVYFEVVESNANEAIGRPIFEYPIHTYSSSV